MGKKHKKHEEHANHERWLVSYADFITLLFAFFVVMFASSQVDRSKSNKMALAVQAAFDSFAIFKDSGGSGQINITDNDKKSVGKKSQTYSIDDEGDNIAVPIQIIQPEDPVVIKDYKGDPSLNMGTGIPTPESEALGVAQRDLLALIDKKKLQGSLHVDLDKHGITLSIKEAGFFDEGADQMTPLSWEILDGVGEILAKLPNQVRIEGHTDDQKVNQKLYPSNWELSSARAAKVLRYLVDKKNLDPARFAAIGYGQYRPVASNKDKEGRLKNRRVEIVVLSDLAALHEQGLSSEEEKKAEARAKKRAKKEPVHLPPFLRN